MRPIIQHLNNQFSVIVCLLLIAGLVIISCGTDSNDDDEPEPEAYSGDFIPAGDDVTTSASGETTATLDPETRELSFTVVWEDLSSPVVAMHFHDDGPVIHDIDGWEAETSGSVTGTITFSAGEVADLADGDVYTQIHTEEYPGGEVISPLTEEGTNSPPPDNNGNGGDPDY